MKQISLSKYKPIISDKEIGEEIYQLIRNNIDSKKSLEVDLSEIASMATFCAKQIFGRLYVELGSKSFFENVHIKGASEDLKSIISIGIQNSLENQSKSESSTSQ